MVRMRSPSGGPGRKLLEHPTLLPFQTCCTLARFAPSHWIAVCAGQCTTTRVNVQLSFPVPPLLRPRLSHCSSAVRFHSFHSNAMRGRPCWVGASGLATPSNAQSGRALVLKAPSGVWCLKHRVECLAPHEPRVPASPSPCSALRRRCLVHCHRRARASLSLCPVSSSAPSVPRASPSPCFAAHCPSNSKGIGHSVISVPVALACGACGSAAIFA